MDRSRGSKQNLPLNEYLSAKFSVWNQYNKHHKTKRYISASHILLYLAYLGYKKGDFPLSELVGNEIMSLPMSPFLTTEQQDFVVKTIKA